MYPKESDVERWESFPYLNGSIADRLAAAVSALLAGTVGDCDGIKSSARQEINAPKPKFQQNGSDSNDYITIG